MATIYWVGGATAVAQVATASIDSLDGTPADNTFTLTVGDEAVSTAGNSTVGQTAADLVALAEASTHPHMSAVTWTNPSGGNITGTADTAGVPFVAALTVTGGGSGSVTDFADDTANAGPSSMKAVDNYSTGALPGGSDTLIVRASTDNIVYDLDAISSLGTLIQEQTFTGTFGLREDRWATTADGATVVATAREYRTTYFKSSIGSVVLGRHTGIGSPTGSGRVKVWNTNTSASTIDVLTTSATSSETYLPPVRLLGSSANLDVFVRDGDVGIAIDRADETATVGDIAVTGSGAAVILGSGVTCTQWTQSAGANAIKGAAATVTLIECTGGTLSIDGDFTATTLNVEGGTVTDNHTKTGGNASTTVNVRAGTWDLQDSDAARTVATVNHEAGGAIRDNPAVTFSTHNRARATISV